MRQCRRNVLRGGVASTAIAILGLPAIAQTWPSKPIRIVVSFTPGGVTDALARAYGDYLSKKLGQPVVVENKGGAGGILGATEVARAAGDGHTLLFTNSTAIISNRVLYKDLPYNPEKDFTFLSYMPSGGIPLIAGTATGATDVKAFAEYARKNAVSVGTYAAGSYAHMAIAELNRFFGVDMLAVHYRGEVPIWTDLAGGSIQGGFGGLGPAQSVVATGRGKVIGVPQPKRMKRIPDVPTFAEQGVSSKAFQLTGYVCALGPAGITDTIANRLSDLFVEAGQSERVQEILATNYIDDTAFGRQAFVDIYREEAPIWLQLVSSLGLTPQ